MKNTGMIHTHCADERVKKWQQANKDLIIAQGDYVKLGFTQQLTPEEMKHIGTEEENFREWMWVKITKVVSQNEFEGTLENDPEHLTIIEYGDSLTFTRDEIAAHEA